jgi:hypothetical protein
MSEASIKLYRDKKLVGSSCCTTTKNTSWRLITYKKNWIPLLDELFKYYPGPLQKEANARSG